MNIIFIRRGITKSTEKIANQKRWSQGVAFIVPKIVSEAIKLENLFFTSV